MPLSAECLAAIHFCRIRVTRLDALGNPTAGPNNSYVSGNPLTLGVTPQVQAGDDKTVVGGCDCIVAEYKGTDKLRRFDLELDLGLLEPGLIEMLTGASAILDVDGNPIGVEYADQLGCDATPQPNVALEGWQDGWDDDHQATDWPYVHWLWPSTRWQPGATTLQNEFNQPKLTGFTRKNTLWGDGIYGDMPSALAHGMPAWWYTASTPPTAVCGYGTHSIS